MMNEALKLIAITLMALSPVLTSCAEFEPDDWNEVTAETHCEDQIKPLLDDPESYKFRRAVIATSEGPYGVATVHFTSSNLSGESVSRSCICEAYNDSGERMITVQLYK